MAAIIVVLAAVLLSVRSLASRDVVVRVDGLGDRSLDILACDDTVVWVRGWSHVDAQVALARGVAAAQAEAYATLVGISQTGEITEAAMGQALIAAFSAARDGTLWIVLLDVSTGRTRTRASMDRGRSWLEKAAPADIIGIAFETRDEGYAWSTTQVYRTVDGGNTWTSRSLLPFRRERGGSSGTARLGARGELWMPLDRPLSDPGALPASTLVVVNPDLSVVNVATWPEDRILAIALDDAAALAALSPRAGGFRVERVALESGASGRSTVVLAQRDAAMKGLQSRGSLFLLHEGFWEPQASMLSNLPATIEVSPDAGKTWRSRDVTDAAVSSACLADAGVWTLSERYKRVTFRPHRR
ncbi:MAG TPA: hypothetical protein VF841_00120 [Anaeromyxobacter sp.]